MLMQPLPVLGAGVLLGNPAQQLAVSCAAGMLCVPHRMIQLQASAACKHCGLYAHILILVNGHDCQSLSPLYSHEYF